TAICPYPMSDDLRRVQRQAFAGMLWSKQFYYYVIKDWLDGDSGGPKPPEERKYKRNHDWLHLYCEDIISMPDAWEYPWFAAWDLAFHTIPLAMIDPEFAKHQLYLFVREWYQHPNGQLPAYEWAFGDVNPPVHAWAAWRVFKIEEKLYGRRDTAFLERVFQKLLLYFTWWVNRKDAEGNNIFAGGFLGLDNIGVFDRSHLSNAIPGGEIEQSDGTSWMGMYCLNMLRIAIELTQTDSAYQDMASKFFQHFLYIADAMNKVGGPNVNLWDEGDAFYYDILHLPNGASVPMKLRSMVGLIPLLAIESFSLETLESTDMKDFKKRFDWFCQNRQDLIQHNNISFVTNPDDGKNVLLALVNQQRLRQILTHMLNPAEFLSPYGIRALSKEYADPHPYTLDLTRYGYGTYSVSYEPAESRTPMFGGNSNWRGPIWFPVNMLIIEALQRFHYYLGQSFTIPCPTGSGPEMNLWEVSLELSRRLTSIFLRDEQQGTRPVYGGTDLFQTNEHWKDLILFYEYFHGDIGAGIGASHQTGWTGLVAKLIQQQAEYPYVPQEPGYAFGAAPEVPAAD
ncbi:MAG: glucosidase, partial [Oscillochloris sp.]|nr:glucosidase [Oscillochloris sp.]